MARLRTLAGTVSNCKAGEIVLRIGPRIELNVAPPGIDQGEKYQVFEAFF
jgi:hypothetical protein